jgi:hypothetical protein
MMQPATQGETRLIYYDVTVNKVDLKTLSLVRGLDDLIYLPMLNILSGGSAKI